MRRPERPPPTEPEPRLARDLAIDLGTANTCVFAQGRGIVLNEPSIVAFNTAEGWSRDVTEEIAAELAQACANRDEMRRSVADFIADHR